MTHLPWVFISSTLSLFWVSVIPLICFGRDEINLSGIDLWSLPLPLLLCNYPIVINSYSNTRVGFPVTVRHSLSILDLKLQVTKVKCNLIFFLIADVFGNKT